MFGIALHAWQDLYAHSNIVEIGDGLINLKNPNAKIRSGVWSADRNVLRDAVLRSSRLHDDFDNSDGFIPGYPKKILPGLNKDAPGREGYARAMYLATQETLRQWGRMKSMICKKLASRKDCKCDKDCDEVWDEFTWGSGYEW